MVTRPVSFQIALDLCLVALFLASAPHVRAQQPPKGSGSTASRPLLPNLDVRATAAASARLSEEGEAKAAAISRRLASMADSAGRPVRYTLGRYGWPKTVSSSSAITEPSSDDAETVARRFLGSESGVSPYSAEDLATLRLRARSSAGALEVLRFRQYAGDVPVYRSSATVAVDGRGRVRSAAFSDPAPNLRLIEPLPRLSAAEAARRALESVGVEVSGPLAAEPERNGRALFPHPEPGQLPVAAELTAFPLPGGAARLAWRVFADSGPGSYETLIAADDGTVLFRASLVADMGSARVFPVNPLSPAEVRDFGDGWLGEGSTVTTGNNIDAYGDIDGNDQPDNFGTPGLSNGRAASESQQFDFDAGDGLQAGSETRAAAIANAFYHSNLAHDYFYGLGFGEAEGNFQTDNFGLGGVGEDAVRVEVHDGLVSNNANFRTRPDGLEPRAQFGLRTRIEGQTRDYALDAPTVMHEYTHGVTSRLVGGPDDVSCLSTHQAGAIAEGWSDYFGGSVYDQNVIGAYLSGDLENGIRRAALDRNPRTYADVGDPRFQVHADGEIWGATLWDIRTAIGAEAADRLIFEALFVTTCDPTYVEARDAILAVDGGEHDLELWTAFAARGLGFGASASNVRASVLTVFNANYDLPPALAPGNRSPRITSIPLALATFGEPYSYFVRSLDPDGDTKTYELLSGPDGVAVDAETGEMTWPSPTFTTHRIQVAVTDGNGGRTVHGFQLIVTAELTFGEPIRISGGAGSFGLATVTVPPDTPILQVRLRGASGTPDLVLFAPDFTTELSFQLGSNETLSILDPAPGEWFARVDTGSAYDDLELAADTPIPTELGLPGEAAGLSDARSGERFFKVVVPEQTPLLRISLAGGGDADLLVARGRVPLCVIFNTLECDLDDSSEGFESYELLELENPEPGEYFITVLGFDSYSDVTLKVALTAPDIQLGGVTDGAQFSLLNAPGGIASLFGVNLADRTEIATSLPLPKELAGVRVVVDGIEAALFFASPTQINFQFPSDAIGGLADLFLVRNGELSQSLGVLFDFAAPQIFVDPNTSLPIVVHASDGMLVTPENPARPGEAIVVYFTGIGFVDETPEDGFASPSGPLANTIFQPGATLGGTNLTVFFAGLTPGLVGLAQANLILPAELPAGSTLPLMLNFDTGFSFHESLPVNLPVGP